MSLLSPNDDDRAFAEGHAEHRRKVLEWRIEQALLMLRWTRPRLLYVRRVLSGDFDHVFPNNVLR